MITLEECRLRELGLPADDGAAQDVIDEQEAWLARRIGALEGARTERFFVGVSTTAGKLGLQRFTDDVELTDGGTAVATDDFRLVEHGSAVVRTYQSALRWWQGPYVLATYSPNDATEVRRVLFALVSIEGKPAGPYDSETIGAYAYTRGSGVQSPAAIRSALVASLLPRHDPALTLVTHRPVVTTDAYVVNRAEPVEPAEAM